MTPKTGSRLVYVLTHIAQMLELTQIEHRLIRLEEQTNGKITGLLLTGSRNRLEEQIAPEERLIVLIVQDGQKEADYWRRGRRREGSSHRIPALRAPA